MLAAGDQALALLQAVGPGTSDLKAFMAGLEEICGGETAYGPLDRQVTKADMPIQGPWRHGSLKEFFANVIAGKNTPATSGGEDKQIDGATKVAICIEIDEFCI